MASRIDSSRESYWNEQSDSLNRLRYGLQDNRSRKYESHSKYRKTPPAYLPRMSTPPVSPQMRGNRSRYNKVPPVQSRSNGYDSWDESDPETLEDDEEIYTQPIVPYPIYPANMAMYPLLIPLQPTERYVRSRRRKAPVKTKPPKRVTYRNTPVYYDPVTPSGRFVLEKDVDIASVHSTSPSPRSSPFDSDLTPTISKYLNFARNPKSPETPFDYWKKNKDFTEEFVEHFIWDCLDEEFVPDELIDVIQQEERKLQPVLLSTSSSKRTEVYQPLSVVSTAVTESVHSVPLASSPSSYEFDDTLIEINMEDIVDEVVEEDVLVVAEEVFRDMADMRNMMIKDTTDDLETSVIKKLEQEMIREVLMDVYAEDTTQDQLENVLNTEMRNIAKEVLSSYDLRKKQKEIDELERQFGDKIGDSFFADHLMKLIARHGKVIDAKEQHDALLDEMVMDTLLLQYQDVRTKRRSTLNNLPLQKLHSRVVTEVALEVLLKPLILHLDEDMAELDIYEMGNLYNMNQTT